MALLCPLENSDVSARSPSDPGQHSLLNLGVDLRRILGRMLQVMKEGHRSYHGQDLRGLQLDHRNSQEVWLHLWRVSQYKEPTHEVIWIIPLAFRSVFETCVNADASNVFANESSPK